MPKLGFCPECKQNVRRLGIRQGKYRYNIIPPHMRGDFTCFGGGMPWHKALARVEHTKVAIIEIGRDL